ncbi:hypothetical protein JCM11641_007472 [Rhodosporidiobolus odoratus]
MVPSEPTETASPTADALDESFLSSLSSLNLAVSTFRPQPQDSETSTKTPADGKPAPADRAQPGAFPPRLSSPTSSSSTPPRLLVLFQPECTGHRYVRNADVGTIVERPERIRAVKTGVAAAWARLSSQLLGHVKGTAGDQGARHELDDSMRSLSLGGSKKTREVRTGPFDVLESSALMSLDDPALKLIHGTSNHASDLEQDAAWLASFLQTSQVTFSGPSSNPTSSTSPATTSTPTRLTRAASASPSKPSNSALSTLPPLSPLPWPTQLLHLIRRTPSALLTQPFSEMPPHLPQGDLYLCPESEGAIFGALGAVCEGVDRIVEGSKDDGGGYDRAFVAIRPPGHHCGEANPQGFCFVNNVAVAAAHAYFKHGINRVVVLDIDLHHGNGTQEIAWKINEEAHRILGERQEKLRARTPQKGGSPKKPAAALPAAVQASEPDPLRIMYGSLHDIWSYPCEDASPSLVAAASLTLSGGHGQFISNAHLEPWANEEEFYEKLWPGYREALLGKAEEFLTKTKNKAAAVGEDEARTLVIISAGFDASPHEYPSMSRHSRNVPTSFYRRLASETLSFAQTHCNGKVLAVLEGGYSDRALASGAGSLLTGLYGGRDGVESREEERDAWWDEPELEKLEKACAPIPTTGKGRKAGAGAGGIIGVDQNKDDPWLIRAVEVFSRIEDVSAPESPSTPWTSTGRSRQRTREETPPAKPMQLRERKVKHDYAGLAAGVSPAGSPASEGKTRRVVSGEIKGKGHKEPSTVPAVGALPPLPPVLPAVNPVAAAEPEPTDQQEQAVGPKVRFTWKQGGFMGEPRM